MDLVDQQHGGMDRYDGLSSPEVLAGIRSGLAAARDLEVEQFRGIIAWADRNTIGDDDGLETPENTIAATAWAGFCDTGLPIAGPDAPLVSEFALAELIAVLGRSPESGRAYVGRCIELGWRLPHICDRVLGGRVRLWKALEVADLTRMLSTHAAAFVDRNIAFVLGSCTWAQVRRLVEEAITRFDPDAAEEARQDAADERCFHIGTERTTEHGLVEIDGLLDAADAIDLDAAIGRRATSLGKLGNDGSFDVRRAIAAGEIARADLTLDLEIVDTETGEVITVARSVAARRPVRRSALSRSASGVRRPAPPLPCAPSSTSPSTSLWIPTRSPTGSATRPSSATITAPSPTADGVHGPATSTTIDLTPGAAVPAPAISCRCVVSTTGSRRTPTNSPAGTTPSSRPAPTCGARPTGTRGLSTTTAHVTSTPRDPSTRSPAPPTNYLAPKPSALWPRGHRARLEQLRGRTADGRNGRGQLSTTMQAFNAVAKATHTAYGTSNAAAVPDPRRNNTMVTPNTSSSATMSTRAST